MRSTRQGVGRVAGAARVGASLLLLLALAACDGGGGGPLEPAACGEGPSTREAAQACAGFARAVEEASADAREGAPEEPAVRQRLEARLTDLVRLAVEGDCGETLLAARRADVQAAASRSLVDPGRRFVAAWWLEAWRRLQVTPDPAFWRDVLFDEQAHPRVRQRAAYALGAADVQAARSAFDELLARERGPRRAWMSCFLDVLVAYHAQGVADFLLDALARDLPDEVTSHLARACGDQPDARLLDPLKRLATGASSPFVRVQAAQAVAHLVGPPCTPWLKSLAATLPSDAGPQDRKVLEMGVNKALYDLLNGQPGPLASSWK